VEEPEARGTAGAIKFAERFLDERFLALNGDVLTDLDLSALLKLHEERGARATLALYPVEDPTAYGLVRRTDDGEILEFLEKPDPEQIDTDEINAGAYVLERDVVELIPDGREVSIEREVFPRLVGDGLYARRLEGYWMDIGTPERYLQASWDILERNVETELGPSLDPEGRLLAAGAEVDPGAELGAAAFVDERVRVGPGARIGPRAVLGHGCEIAAEAVVSEAVLHPACRVGRAATIRGAILAAGVEVGADAVVDPGAVVGEGARIAAGAHVHGDARVEPAGSA
jgi:mannose-1-phosphate guanylyltransferase